MPSPNITVLPMDGDIRCKCIEADFGDAATPNGTKVNIDGVEVLYPKKLGAYCNAWDDGRYPGTCQATPDPSGKSNGFCRQKWCYVDPCACDLEAAETAGTYVNNAKYKGREVHVSYATCGGVDKTGASKDACSGANSTACAAVEGCVLVGSKCMRTKLAVICSSKDGEKATFDCNAGLLNWRESWSEEKKQWCCKNKSKGCELVTFDGIEGCKCVPANRGGGSAIIDGSQTKYAEGFGNTCSAWDDGVYPGKCETTNQTPGMGSGWCAQAWCYVDPCACNLNGTWPKRSAYAPGALYNGKPLFYSYAACNSVDTFPFPANQSDVDAACGRTDTRAPAVNHGMASCPCVAAATGGPGQTTVGNGTYTYPGGFGSTCEAWDDGRYPGKCETDGQDPGKGNGWCAQKWCFVDPCACDAPVPPKPSSYLLGVKYNGKPLYWSYATCNGTGSLSAEPSKEKDRDILSICGKQEEGQPTNASQVNRGMEACRCVTATTESSVQVTIGSDIYPYPGGLGSYCRAWDDGQYPGKCESEGQVPGKGRGWCAEKWCFVDPCACDASVTTEPSGYLPNLRYRGKPLYWSFTTCSDMVHVSARPRQQRAETVAMCRNADGEKMSLRFEELDYASTNLTLLMAQVLDQLQCCVQDVSQLKVTLRAGSIIADITGPSVVMGDLRQNLPSSTITVMGSTAKVVQANSTTAATEPKEVAVASNDTVAASKHVAMKAEHVPTESKDVAATEPKDVAKKPKNVTAKSADAATEPKDAAVASNDTVAASKHVAMKAEHVPAESKDVAATEPTDVAKKPKNVTAKSADAAAESKDAAADAAAKYADAAEKSAAVAAKSEDAAAESNDAPAEPKDAAMDSKDVVPSKGQPAASAAAGAAGCRCVTATTGNKTLVTIGNATHIYPGGLGRVCRAWDDGRYPAACEAGDQSPGLHQGWCTRKWCFVDPCACDSGKPPKQSTYLPDVRYKGRPLYVSYDTCLSDYPPSRTGASDDKDIEAMCSKATPAAATAPATEAVQSDQTTLASAPTEEVVKSGQGMPSSAQPWEAVKSGQTPPTAQGADNGQTTPASAPASAPPGTAPIAEAEAAKNVQTTPALVPPWGAVKNNQTATTAEAEAAKNAQTTPSSAPAVGGTHISKLLPTSEAKPGIVHRGQTTPRCECKQVQGSDVAFFYDGQKIGYPRNVGSSCLAWDEGIFPGKCTSADQDPGKGKGWCAENWCFVDPCTCKDVPILKSLHVMDATEKGRPLYLSYAACGSDCTFGNCGKLADADPEVQLLCSSR